MSLLHFFLVAMFVVIRPQNSYKPSDKIDEDDLRVSLAK
jgi:hypothetical protein